MRSSYVRRGIPFLLAGLFVGLVGSLSAGRRPRPLDGRLQELSSRSGSVSVLVRLRKDAELPRFSAVRYGGRLGDIVTAHLPARVLPVLAGHADVMAIEPSTSLALTNDVASGSVLGVRGTAPAAPDTYSYAGTAGETVTVTAHGEGGVDTTLVVDLIPDGANSGPGSDDRVTVTFATSGPKVIDVTCGGNYVLTVKSDRGVGSLTGGDITPTNGTFHLGSGASVARAIDSIDGSNTIIGFVDSGIDFANLDFRFDTAPNNTRLLSIWDQTLSKETDEFTPTGFAYGVEYTELMINNHLNGSLPGYVRQTDTGGHGTTVAGIAAGDGSLDGAGTGFRGVAPGARLIMVKSTLSSASVIDGIAYIKARAQQANMPCVINLSLGTHDGPHDGTSLLDQAVSAITDPGLAVVVAAGNEGFGPAGAETVHDQMIRPSFTAGTFTYDPIDTATSTPNLATHIVISEFRISGTPTLEFIELYNPTNTPVPIAAWSIEFDDGVGGGGVVVTFAAGASIPAFSYYLVAVSGFSPPFPDAIATNANMMNGASDGTITLKDDAGGTVDLVGFGSSAPFVEGAGPYIGSNGERFPGGTSGNGVDTDSNNVDFFTPGAPNPQNSSSSELPGEPHIVDIWASPGDLYAVTVTDGTVAGTVSAADGTAASVVPVAPSREYAIANRTDTPSNGATHIRIKLAHSGPLAGVTYAITLTRVGGTGNGVVDAYAANLQGRFIALNTPAQADGSFAGTIAEPGTANGAITVGAYVSKFRWDSSAGTTEKATESGLDVLTNPRVGNIHVSSSRGPTRDGRVKPEIAAPGFWIGATRLTGFAFAASDIDVDTDYVYQSGTSFAAPQVSGVVALLFSKSQVFDSSTVLFYLRQSALTDSQTDNVGGLPNNAFGYGKVNAPGLTAIVKSTVTRKAHNAHCSVAAAGPAAGLMAVLVLAVLILGTRRERNRA